MLLSPHPFTKESTSALVVGAGINYLAPMEREMDNHWKQLAEERMIEIHRAREIIEQLKRERELQLQEINALTNERNRAYDRLKKLEGPPPNDMAASH
jgi:biotin-(acetyl-CoA carboxylase) ligase